MSFHSAGPSSSSVPILDGTIPGLIDPTQVERLCRFPGSKISFASFDPYTVTSNRDLPALNNLSLHEELYRPKRVVIETTSAGAATWRFVPSARRDHGVVEEGKWPRVVDVCGQHFECSQEQWDIYKLDPLYDCYVGAPPHIPIITRVAERPPPPLTHGQKRREATPLEERPPKSPHIPKTRLRIQTESEDEQSEVEYMIVDEQNHRPKSAGPSDKAKKFKEQMMVNRKERKERMARRMEHLSHLNNLEEENGGSSVPPAKRRQSAPISPTTGKRKVTTLFDSLRTNGNTNADTTQPMGEEFTRNTTSYLPTKDGKRTRTVSPSSAKRNLAATKQFREKQKGEQRRKELEARRLARDAEVLAGLYKDADMADVSQESAHPRNGVLEHMEEGVHAEENHRTDDAAHEEAARQAAIQESRQKLAALEADRPLWEAAARKRKEQEQRDVEELKLKIEAKKREEEAERMRKQQENRRKETEELNRKTQQEAERRHAEQEEKIRRQQAKRERDSWNLGYWNVERAKERYNKLADRFDKTKFSPNEVSMTAYDIPWPMLARGYELEDVTWKAVADFFNAIRPTMKTTEYKKLIIKSHLRFHTDRWASRRLLESVVDDTERQCIDIANRMVIQQLTPIWEDVCGRHVH